MFNLRKGVKFHDGTPWNAAAACYNFNRWYNWTGAVPGSVGHVLLPGYVRRLQEERGRESVAAAVPQLHRAGRKSRIVVRLNRPSGVFFPSLVIQSFAMQSPTAMKKYGADQGDAQWRDVPRDRLVCVPASDRHRSVQVLVVDDRPEGRARPLREVLGPEGEAGQDHHPPDLEQRGALPGAEDGRDQRVRPGTAAGPRRAVG